MIQVRLDRIASKIRFAALAVATVAGLGTTAVANDPAMPPGLIPQPYTPSGEPFVAGPQWVPVYEVGHIKRHPLSRIFWYSTYHPYIDQLKEPHRTAVYGNRHARYYAGYRFVDVPDWHAWYVPTAGTCVLPGVYGWTPAPVAGMQQTNYGPTAAAPGGSYSVAAPQSAGHQQDAARYTGEPNVFTPYGTGAAAYYGGYR